MASFSKELWSENADDSFVVLIEIQVTNKINKKKWRETLVTVVLESQTLGKLSKVAP